MNFLTIVIICLGSVLVLILLAVIIWRIYLKYTNKDTNKKTNDIGHTTKATVDKLSILNSLNDAVVLCNILVKNPFAKRKHSLFSGVVIAKNKIYILTDLILAKTEQILFNNNGAHIWKNKKLIKKPRWEIYWLNEMSGWLNRRFKDQYEIVIFVDETINLNQIDNQTKYRCMSINQLNDEILSDHHKNINVDKAVDIFLKNNLFQGNSSR
ncbi:hypothetical protein MCAV_07430 [[Mycoplasma] cavipharyngis]|uniref:hypothetical protein n=1 Tax=[Mycoplasma] cavipharyngis TaxID=92757 RepID=UPI0037048B41